MTAWRGLRRSPGFAIAALSLLAPGAGPREIALATLVRVLVMVAVGAACGTAMALWTGGLMRKILWGVRPGDWRVLGAAWGLMLATAVAAAALPAWRAARVDPAATLRES